MYRKEVSQMGTLQTSFDIPSAVVKAAAIYGFLQLALGVGITADYLRRVRSRNARAIQAENARRLHEACQTGTVIPFKRPGRAEVVFQCVSCRTLTRTEDLTVLDTWRCQACSPAPVALADGASS